MKHVSQDLQSAAGGHHGFLLLLLPLLLQILQLLCAVAYSLSDTPTHQLTTQALQEAAADADAFVYAAWGPADAEQIHMYGVLNDLHTCEVGWETVPVSGGRSLLRGSAAVKQQQLRDH